MWTEPSTDIQTPETNNKSADGVANPAVVESVASGSIGEELGLEPGDKLVSINGIKPRDIIDYQFLTAEEKLIIQKTQNSLHREKHFHQLR